MTGLTTFPYTVKIIARDVLLSSALLYVTESGSQNVVLLCYLGFLVPHTFQQLILKVKSLSNSFVFGLISTNTVYMLLTLDIIFSQLYQ